MNKLIYYSITIIGLILMAFGMAEVVHQSMRGEAEYGDWAMTIGTWGIILIIGTDIYRTLTTHRKTTNYILGQILGIALTVLGIFEVISQAFTGGSLIGSWALTTGTWGVIFLVMATLQRIMVKHRV